MITKSKISSHNLDDRLRRPNSIRPLTPKLSGDGSIAKSHIRKDVRRILVILTYLIISCTAIGMLFFVPQRYSFIDSTNVSKLFTESDTRTRVTTTVEPSSPFRDLQLERAKKLAEDTLREFSKLQDIIEREQNGGVWTRDRYANLIDQANSADTMFRERNFESAHAEYQKAARTLSSLIEEGRSRIADGLASGKKALENRDQGSARTAFGSILTINPNNIDAKLGLERVAQLPMVSKALLESDREELKGNFTKARDWVIKAQEIDPETVGIAERLQRIERAIEEKEFQKILSQAFAALRINDFNQAETYFDKALTIRPYNAVAKAGKTDTQKKKTENIYQELKRTAEAHVAKGELSSALATYSHALKLEPTLSFALKGRDKLQKVMDLSQSIDRVLKDPHILSSDNALEAAKQTLVPAKAQAGFNHEYDKRLAQLEKILEVASKPLPLVLVSDERTKVYLATIGQLGRFTRREFMLRPGRYLLTGSQDGCRDVRKFIIVKPSMDPILIQCEERI